MKRQFKTISPKFNKCVLTLAILSIVIVIGFIATDHIPAFTPILGTIFETANGFAISYLVTTIFYIFTVYYPEKKKYENTSRYILIEKKRLNAELERYSFFIIAQANYRTDGIGISLENINKQSVEKAYEVFKNIPEDNIVWENLYNYIDNMVSQLEIFLGKYSDLLSEELYNKTWELIDNATFSNVKNASNRTQLIKTKTLFLEYFSYADRFIKCNNLMMNAIQKKDK